MIYGFICNDCGAQTEWIASLAKYEASAAAAHEDRLCSACGGPTTRDVVGDARGSFTERPMFYGEDVPESVAGKGGFSREREKILKAAGLVQKDDGRPQRTKRQHFFVKRDRITVG